MQLLANCFKGHMNGSPVVVVSVEDGDQLRDWFVYTETKAEETIGLDAHREPDGGVRAVGILLMSIFSDPSVTDTTVFVKVLERTPLVDALAAYAQSEPKLHVVVVCPEGVSMFTREEHARCPRLDMAAMKVAPSPVRGERCKYGKRCPVAGRCKYSHTKKERQLFDMYPSADFGFYKTKLCSDTACQRTRGQCFDAHRATEGYCLACGTRGHIWGTAWCPGKAATTSQRGRAWSQRVGARPAEAAAPVAPGPAKNTESRTKAPSPTE